MVRARIAQARVEETRRLTATNEEPRMIDLTAAIETYGVTPHITHMDLFYKGQVSCEGSLITDCVLIDLTGGAEDIDDCRSGAVLQSSRRLYRIPLGCLELFVGQSETGSAQARAHEQIHYVDKSRVSVAAGPQRLRGGRPPRPDGS